MGMISTVRGEVSHAELGLTTMHEHLLCDLSAALGPVLKLYSSKISAQALALTMENLSNLRGGMGAFSKECSTAGAVDYTVAELGAFKAMGGGCVVDASPIGARGPIRELQEASLRSDVHIVACTGLYIADAQPDEYKAMDEGSLAALFEKEVVEGIESTGVKAGFLKCAVNTLGEGGGIDASELKAVRACAKAAARTGRSIHIHSAYPLTAEHILPVARLVLELGVPPEKLLMLHMDSFVRTPRTNLEYAKDFSTVKTVCIEMQLRLLDMGVNIGFDSWDTLTTTLPDNFDRLKALAELLRRGYGGQITLGHDVTDKTRGVTYGYTGFTGFIRNAFPMLRELGYEAELQKMAVENPARILAYNL